MPEAQHKRRFRARWHDGAEISPIPLPKDEASTILQRTDEIPGCNEPWPKRLQAVAIPIPIDFLYRAVHTESMPRSRAAPKESRLTKDLSSRLPIGPSGGTSAFRKGASERCRSRGSFGTHRRGDTPGLGSLPADRPGSWPPMRLRGMRRCERHMIAAAACLARERRRSRLPVRLLRANANRT